MNFKDFKKIDVTSTHTVFKHPEGHTIHVSHDSLSPQQKRQMKEIPIESALEKLRDKKSVKKLNKGTEKPIEELSEEDRKKIAMEGIQGLIEQKAPQSMPSESEVPAQPEVPLMQRAGQAVRSAVAPIGESVKDVAGAYGVIGKGVGQFTKGLLGSEEQAQPAQAVEQIDNFPLEGQQPGQQQLAAMPEAPQGKSEYEKSLDLFEKGGRMISEAAQLEAAQTEQSAAQAVDFMKQREDLLLQKTAGIDNKIAELEKAQAEGKIDPNRFMSQNYSSIADKLRLGLGLLIGGLGGPDNQVQKSLDTLIERDIESQKKEMENRDNLLSAYYKKLGSMKEAENMLRLHHMSMLEMEARKLGAKTAGMKAQGELMQFTSNMMAKRQDIKNQVAAQQADAEMMRRMQVGQQLSLPEVGRLIETKIPESARKEAREELKQHAKLVSGINRISQISDQIFEQSRIAARLGKPFDSTKTLKALQVQLVPVIKLMTKEGKFTDQDFKILVEPQIPSIMTSRDAANTLKELLVSSLREQIEPETTVLQTYIPGYKPAMPVRKQIIPNPLKGK
jgi:hypothetical protein